jgi:hypothetical protein
VVLGEIGFGELVILSHPPNHWNRDSCASGDGDTLHSSSHCRRDCLVLHEQLALRGCGLPRRGNNPIDR